MRVALLTSADSWRGSGASFAAIYAGLHAHGHRPHLVTAAECVTRAFVDRGMAVTELPLRRTRPAEIARLRRLLRVLESEVLVTDMPRDLRLGALATLGSRTRLVSRYNRGAAPPQRDALVRLAYRWRVDATVFLTAGGMRRTLAAAPFMRHPPAQAIPNGIDAAAFAPDPAAGAAYRARHGLDDRALVLAVGALTREKGHDLIVQALARLHAPRPVLHLCGEGPLAEPTRALASALGVELQLVGQLAPADLRAAYSAATVFVHGCAGETFGRAIAEAMACRCAVIVPDGGAAPEVVGPNDAAGILVPPRDPAALADAIAALVADPERRARLGRAARARAEREFTEAAMAAAYSRLVEAVSG